MKEVDETPVTESISEEDFEFCVLMIGEESLRLKELEARVVKLEKRVKAAQLDRIDLDLRIANLETQRTPQDENDDPEWYA